MSTAPYGSINPTPHTQVKNRRRALIVRRHRAMARAAAAAEQPGDHDVQNVDESE